MAALHRLSVKTVETKPPGKHADGGGLWLHRRADGGGQWFLRVVVHGRRREMGLGGVDDLTLAEVREEAAKWRKLAKAGSDPIKVREKERRDAARNLHILDDVALDAYESRKAELKDDGKAGRWFTPLSLHVLPKLGKLPVADIDQLDIRNTLAPIWHTKADTARKAMNRLSIVMKHAAALGLEVDLQAVEKAKALLGKTRHQPQHIPSLHWQDVPEFYASLDECSVTHLALRLLILTGVRSKPLRRIRLDQIEGDIWTVPAEDMKGRKGATTDFRVPLSKEALRVVEEASQFATDGQLFPSVRRGVISDATLSRLMQRRGMEARPHGFRTSLRTWLADCTDAPYEVAETVIAHAVGNKVERTYRRTDFLEQRRVLMGRWANHCGEQSSAIIRLAGT